MPVEDLRFRRLLAELRGGLVDRAGLRGGNRALFVHRLADDVQDAAQRGVAHRHRNRRAEVLHRGATDQTFGRVHGDGADGVLAQMLRDFQNQTLAVVVRLERVQDRRKRPIELHVDDGADHLRDFALCHVVSPVPQSASAPEMISISSLVIAA